MKRIIIFLLVLCIGSLTMLFAVNPEDAATVSENPDEYSMVTSKTLTASVDLTTLVENGVAIGFANTALAGNEFSAYDNEKNDICTKFVLDKVVIDDVHAESLKPYFLRWRLYSPSNINIFLKAKGPMHSDGVPVINLNWKITSTSDSQYCGGTVADTASTEYDKKIKVATYDPGPGVSGSFGFKVETENLINKPTEKTYEGIILAEVIAE